ncbi:MAG: SigE family RNA polymerase sigma factor [Gemmatimonadota bacterium]|nr:SigE family RNA polymerase sigma factor [Gemmatimonadota bacterium]
MTSESGPSASEAWRLAFEGHYRAMLRLAVLLTGSREVAEDLVHDTFLRTADRMAALSPEDMWPYLRRSLINRWKNTRRRQSIERRLQSSSPQDPDVTGDAIDDRDMLWRAMRVLSPRQRACLILRYYEDLTERETADVLRCSVGSVKSHTSRGVARLRREVHYEY